MNDATKAAVLNQLNGGAWKPAGQTTFRFSVGIVHARFKSSGPFSFNINPVTLRADYELWICGSPDRYYLLPKSVVRDMYEHPAAYVDRRHPEIRVVSVDVENHRARYARDTDALGLSPFFRSTLRAPAV